MSISTTIKSIQDIMRQDAGVDGDAQRISQLVWMLFLKIFDDNEVMYEWDDAYTSPLPEALQWRNWAEDKEGITGDELLNFVNNTLFPQLQTLDPQGQSRGFIIREMFADSYNYMKSGTLMRQIINKINEIDFTNQQESHLFNDIYEKILRDLQSAGNAGEYYTPRPVTQFMVDMINPQLGQTVLDPACGTGGFLICALEHLRKQAHGAADMERLEKSIRGIEKKPLPHMLAITNLFLHGQSEPDVLRDNTLTLRPYNAYTPADRVDVILTNPPFGGTEEDGVEKGFPRQFQTKETADLFLAWVMHLLKEGGQAGVVLPDGFLFGEGVKTRIKERLLTTCNLHTIVRLPKGVFAPYTSINTNLLFFRKGEPTQEIWYFEHPTPSDRKNYSKTRPIAIEEFDREKAWWTAREHTPYAWCVTREEIEARGYNLDISNPYEEEQKQIDPQILLAQYEAQQEAVQTTRTQLKEALLQALSQTGGLDA